MRQSFTLKKLLFAPMILIFLLGQDTIDTYEFLMIEQKKYLRRAISFGDISVLSGWMGAHIMGIDIAVCDSDMEIANDIKHLIALHQPEARVEIFLSADELRGHEDFFDIYFLDIKGISGLEIARDIREKQKRTGGIKSILIFVTGFSEHMEEAFDVQAFHYLLKPIKTGKFLEVLDKAMKEAEVKQKQEESYVLLKIPNRKKKVLLRNVFYVESSNKKVMVHTTEGIYEVQGKMDDFELAFGSSFYRCHRCYLVNLSKISSYRQNEIEIANGDKILLAYKKYSAFVKAYLSYAKRGGMVNV